MSLQYSIIDSSAIDVATVLSHWRSWNSFRIIQTISYREYAIAAGAALAFFSSFYVAFIVVIVWRKWKRVPPVGPSEEGKCIYNIKMESLNTLLLSADLENSWTDFAYSFFYNIPWSTRMVLTERKLKKNCLKKSIKYTFLYFHTIIS